MNRHLRAMVLGLALVYALPATVAYAQMDFGGLDLGGKKKKKKKKKDTEETTKPTEEAKPPPTEDKSAQDKALEGLDLSKPPPSEEKAAKPEKGSEKKGGGTAGTMTFDTVDVTGKTADRQKIDAAIGMFKNEKYEDSALASYELQTDPKMAGLQLEAQYNLAKSLYRMGMYHSALGQFSKILAHGPTNNKFFKTSLEWLFFISHKTTNETVILDEIAKYSNFEFPEKFRSEFHYLLARYYFVRGKALDEVDQKGEADASFDQVRRLVLLIPKGDAFYPRAKYLEGLAYFRDNKLDIALESMKEVVRSTRPAPGEPPVKGMQELRELAFMQLARTHYGANQPGYAIYYYDKVERGNTQWLESLFEASWANYRLGKYERALGNLITLSSPFFREEYFPEALILKAVIYYENCRYKEARSILADFEQIYGPVQEKLDEISQKTDANDYYNLLHEIEKKNKEGLEHSGTDLILERVLKLALTDKDLKKTNDSILELEDEIDSIGRKSDAFKYSDLAKALIENLKGQREKLIQKAGVMSKGKIQFELDFLKQLRANGLRIKFEVNDKERENLEKSLQEGMSLDELKHYKLKYGVPDNQLYWPFEGEFWRDELGTYQYTLTKGCKEKGGGAETASVGGSGRE